jgi:hypothetical protein
MKNHLAGNQESKIISQAKILMAMETWRRCVLVFGLLACAVMATWTDFHPYYTVKEPTKWDIQALSTEVAPKQEEPRTPDALIQKREETTERPELIAVQGAQWEQWFTSINKVLQKGELTQSWRHRLSNDQLRELQRFEQGTAITPPDIRRLVFGQKEEPLASLLAGKHPGEEVVLALTTNQKQKQYLMVYYSTAPALTGLGSSLFGIPEAFSYPLRHLWLPALAIMLLIYALLPWQHASKNVCAYKRWQIILGDFGSCLLYGGFMALPFLIVGGAIEAVTTWALFTGLFWCLAALGLCALWWTFFYASYCIYMLDNQLIFTCPQGIRTVALEEITSIEPVRCVPPKWLIALAFLAAISGRGRGRALLLANSSTTGYCIATTAGEAIYVWQTNSMGQASMTNLNRLEKILESLPCPRLSDVREFEAIFPPVIEAIGKNRTNRVMNRATGGKVKSQKLKEGSK